MSLDQKKRKNQGSSENPRGWVLNFMWPSRKKGETFSSGGLQVVESFYPETIDLLMETGVGGNIQVRDVMDSINTIPPKT
jgi:hypothetical protein